MVVDNWCTNTHQSGINVLETCRCSNRHNVQELRTEHHTFCPESITLNNFCCHMDHATVTIACPRIPVMISLKHPKYDIMSIKTITEVPKNELDGQVYPNANDHIITTFTTLKTV